jgi:hypothetical protein
MMKGFGKEIRGDTPLVLPYEMMKSSGERYEGILPSWSPTDDEGL